VHLILAGPPGSGKGTIGDRLFEEFGIVNISTGQLLRDEIANNTPIGKEVSQLVETGQYVHEDFWLPLLKQRLAKPDCMKGGWLVDGAPRTKRHVAAFEKMGIIPNKVILLEINQEVAVERVSCRRMDPVTGKTFHMKHFPPPNEEVTARLIQRSDDAADKAQVRYNLFLEHFADVHSWYPQDIFCKVDASRTFEEVYNDVKAALGKL